MKPNSGHGLRLWTKFFLGGAIKSAKKQSFARISQKNACAAVLGSASPPSPLCRLCLRTSR